MKIAGVLLSFFLLLDEQVYGASGPSSGPFGGGMDGPDGRAGGPPMFPPGIDFVNNTCPVNVDAATPCLVGPPNNQTAGAWVCRTLYDIVTGDADTFSACVDANHFLDTDSCGCCGGECPSTDPCSCSCDLPPPPIGDGNFGPPRGDGNFGPPRGDGNFGPPRNDGNLRSPFGPPPGNFNGTFGPPPGNFDGTFGPPTGNFNGTSANVTGVLVQVVGDDKTMCVPTNVSSRMITGPGFFGRFECVATCS